MGMNYPVTLIEGLKTREFRDPGDVLQWAEYQTPEGLLLDEKKAEVVIKSHTLPIMVFVTPDAITGDHHRMRVAFSPEVERLLGVPINTIWEERQRFERENRELKIREARHIGDKQNLQGRLDEYHFAPWWKKLWWVLRGKSI